MLRVGIAGIGFMGMIHYLAYQKLPGAQVNGICTRDTKKLAGDWRGIQGNFGPPGEQMDLSEVAVTTPELSEILASPEIDLVDLCLPPHLHAEAAIAAFQAGKHVFCEKPIALTIEEADRMVEAANQAGKLLLIGHVLPFFPEYAFAVQAIREGTYGKLLGGHFRRIISDPKWLPDFYDPGRVGGPLVDLHIHDAHFIRLICGMPKAVYARGRMRGEVAEFADTHFLFDDPSLVVSAAGGVINQQGRAFMHGFEIYLEQATLVFSFAANNDGTTDAQTLTVFTDQDTVEKPELASGDPIDGFTRQLAEVVRSVESGQSSPTLGGDLARDALVLCHKETESILQGELVQVS